MKYKNTKNLCKFGETRKAERNERRTRSAEYLRRRRYSIVEEMVLSIIFNAGGIALRSAFCVLRSAFCF
jgi:hypothetical protein